MAQLQRLALAPSQFQNQQIILSAEQQHYLVRVLRLREGDRFIAIDGQGQWWLVRLKTVETLHATSLQAEIIESLPVQTELPVTVTLMVALPKGNGFDDVVRCCTELGVACLLPVVSDRTLPRPSAQKLERWRRIAGEAAEQSERQIVPTILDPVPFATALSLAHDKKYICVARGDSPHLLDCLQDKGDGGWVTDVTVAADGVTDVTVAADGVTDVTVAADGVTDVTDKLSVGREVIGETNNPSATSTPHPPGSPLLGGTGEEEILSTGGKGGSKSVAANDNRQTTIALATGPEGGWTPAEIEQAKLAGFQPVCLGRRILRAVTAPLVALSLVAAAWESEK